MGTPINPNLTNGDSASWKAKAPAALLQISADIDEIDVDLAAWSAYTNAEVKDAVERMLNRERTDLVNLRKIVNLLVNKL